jgi:hypothetical protein
VLFTARTTTLIHAQKCTVLHELFFQILQSAREKHVRALRPRLASQENSQELSQLMDMEDSRSVMILIICLYITSVNHHHLSLLQLFNMPLNIQYSVLTVLCMCRSGTTYTYIHLLLQPFTIIIATNCDHNSCACPSLPQT